MAISDEAMKGRAFHKYHPLYCYRWIPRWFSFNKVVFLIWRCIENWKCFETYRMTQRRKCFQTILRKSTYLLSCFRF